VVAQLEGGAHGSREMVPDGFIVRGAQCLLQIVPCRGPGKKCLTDVETEPVVIGVEEPSRDVVPLRGSFFIVTGSNTSSPTNSTSTFPSLALRTLISGSPQTLKTWLDRMFLSRSPMSKSSVALTKVAGSRRRWRNSRPEPARWLGSRTRSHTDGRSRAYAPPWRIRICCAR